MPPSTDHAVKELTFLFIYRLISENDSGELSEDQLDEIFTDFWEGQPSQDQEGSNLDLNEPNRFKTFTMVKKLLSKKADIETRLVNFLEKKDLSYIDKVERAILTVGFFSIEENSGERNSLINYYVDLAKRYGKENSYSLVNGVLDKL